MTIRLFVFLLSSLVAALLSGGSLQAQDTPLYKHADAPVEKRVSDLLSRMTTEEKFWQLFMVPGDVSHGMEKYSHGIFGLSIRDRTIRKRAADQMLDYTDTTAAQAAAERTNEVQRYFVDSTRLGIPIIPFDEGLHGLVRADATSFPQSIGLAATWDVPLVGRVASAIATEARTRGVRDVLSPVINLAHDVRWGRVEETYGEDPFLCSRIAAAYTGSFTREGVITTPKHMIVNSGDGGRDSYPIDYNERFLDEEDFQPYLACIHEGGTQSVMTAYNSLNGEPCTSNAWLLRTILKGKWGFEGFVISDASAVGGLLDLHHVVHNREESAKRAIEGGLDVIFQSDYEHHVPLLKAFTDGMVDTTAINDAVARVLRAKFKLGLFENPYGDPAEAARSSGSPAHRALALEAARESMVLLKNDGALLPLKKSIHSLAVIGPDAVEARLGGYSGPGIKKVSILEGIRKKLGKGTKLLFSPGCGRLDTPFVTIPSRYLVAPDGSEGLRGEYFNNLAMTGTPALARTDREMDFRWTLFSPDPSINADWFSVRWTGSLRAPRGGTVRIGVEGDDGYRLFIDGTPVVDTWGKQSFEETTAPFTFVEGRRYTIRMEFKTSVENVKCRLIWDAGVPDHAVAIRKAVDVARESDAVVVVGGLEEGEFRDRADIGLPGSQDAMIRQIAATGKPVVVVIVGGSAVTMERWIDGVRAVLDVWYPGEVGGDAVADVLFGDYNPGAKLPITFPRSVGQLPLTYNHKPTGRGDDYYDMTGKPAYPFGYGLSYTTFVYADLQVDPPVVQSGGKTTIRFTVQNSGQVAGDEVAQLYLKDLVSSTVTPVRALKAFSRVHLEPGEKKEVSFDLLPDAFSLLNEKMDRVVEPGTFRIMVGSSSRDIRLRGSVDIVQDR
ncbi:MAG: glycoside hydrolase family 3 C-terminal domain-containing protein [Bacteroidota bacterium]